MVSVTADRYLPRVDEEILNGGVNTVTRVGDTVRRPTGAWSPAVHALLRHLDEVYFTGAPRFFGIDDTGREVLDFIAGDVTWEPPARETGVSGAGSLLRRYHDATVGFVPPEDAVWYHPVRQPAEVICHGDVAPYNTVFRDGTPVAFIDFDTAHPGPRLHDVAYGAYRFVGLSANVPLGEQILRLRAFCDGYELDDADRLALPAVAVDRLRALIAHMRARAAAGDEAFAKHLADGHDEVYLADIAHLERYGPLLAGGLVDWPTTEAIAAAVARFENVLPGWTRPAAYGVGLVAPDGSTRFPRVNVGEHYLPALVLAVITGHTGGTASYELDAEQLRQAIAMLRPAEECDAYDHPNLQAWRQIAGLVHSGAATTIAVVFVADLDDPVSSRHDEGFRQAVRAAPGA